MIKIYRRVGKKLHFIIKLHTNNIYLFKFGTSNAKVSQHQMLIFRVYEYFLHSSIQRISIKNVDALC